jgi:hypothetical protein
MRIGLGIAQFAGNALLKLLRDEMLQPFGLVVQLVNSIIEHAEEECFDQPVMANNLERPLTSAFGEADAAMGIRTPQADRRLRQAFATHWSPTQAQPAAFEHGDCRGRRPGSDRDKPGGSRGPITRERLEQVQPSIAPLVSATF